MRMIEAAGAEPVLVSLQHPQTKLAEIARTLDALVLPGSPADVNPSWYHSPRHARSAEPDIGLRPPGPAAVDKGERLLVALAASYQRYWAEIGRTFFLGKPSPESSKSHDLAKGLFRKLVEGAKVGSSSAVAATFLSEVPVAARNSLAAYGLGNGIGLDMSEGPFLGREDSVKLQPGMTLTLRVCFSGEDCGSALISRPFLMSANGLQPLAKPVEEPVLIEA